MRLRRNAPDLTEIVNQAFSYTVKDENNTEKVLSMKIEAANINRRGDTQLLVSKSDEQGTPRMQWIDFETFNIWWQLHGKQALAL